jgi:elongation factor Ts
MTNTDMIKELRSLTQAGMKDCKEALEESGWDIQKAVDVIKTKGLNIADGRSGRAASEGIVAVVHNTHKAAVMLEVNCQTDFVANSPDFRTFARKAVGVLCDKWNRNQVFQTSDVETERQALVSITKENVVVRRWWVEEAVAPNARVFSYVHSNNKIGVLVTLLAPSEEAARSQEFIELGENMAMQTAAMNPLGIDVERLSADEVTRQKAIFEQQLTELNKPQAAWPKILEGKFRKWHTEVCLMEQESVWIPKTSVKQVVANVGIAVGGEIKVVTLLRCQVGEGIEVKKDNLAEEVAKLTGTEVETKVLGHRHSDGTFCERGH